MTSSTDDIVFIKSKIHYFKFGDDETFEEFSNKYIQSPQMIASKKISYQDLLQYLEGNTGILITKLYAAYLGLEPNEEIVGMQRFDSEESFESQKKSFEEIFKKLQEDKNRRIEAIICVQDRACSGKIQEVFRIKTEISHQETIDTFRKFLEFFENSKVLKNFANLEKIINEDNWQVSEDMFENLEVAAIGVLMMTKFT